jgi:hypothetical protein
VVGNGWYFRDLAQVWLWRQANQLVHGEKLYEAAKRAATRHGSLREAVLVVQHVRADVAWSVTPRPEYHADG